MDKRAYEHLVGLAINKEAGFLDNAGQALKDTWDDVKDAWKNAPEETKRNLIGTGATGILGALLGGVLGGGKGLLLGGIGGSLAGYTGSKHIYPWINKWYDYYNIYRTSDEMANALNDAVQAANAVKAAEANKSQPINIGGPTDYTELDKLKGSDN